MTDHQDTPTNGGGDSPEALQVKAAHRQELARIEGENERAMAAVDAEALRRMPLPLRMIFDDRLRQKIERAAVDMSEAVGFVPKHLIGATAACKVALTKAVTWNLDPYAVANSCYQTPDGRVGFEGKLYRAIAEASGQIRGAITHTYYGDWSQIPRPSFKITKVEKTNRATGKSYTVELPMPAWEYWSADEAGLGVTIAAVLADTGEEVSIDFDLVDAYPRNATTWPTRPKLQLLNPAIRAFVNLVRPSLLMGVNFQDAPSDVPEMHDITPETAPAAPAERATFVSQISAAPEAARAGPPTPRREDGLPEDGLPEEAPAAASEAPPPSSGHAQATTVPSGQEDTADAPSPDNRRERVRYTFLGCQSQNGHGQIRDTALAEIRAALATCQDESAVDSWVESCRPPLDTWPAKDAVVETINDRLGAMPLPEPEHTEVYGFQLTEPPAEQQPKLYYLSDPGGSRDTRTADALVENLEGRVTMAADKSQPAPLALLDSNHGALKMIASDRPDLAERIATLQQAGRVAEDGEAERR